jgi:hypothetical protein
MILAVTAALGSPGGSVTSRSLLSHNGWPLFFEAAPIQNDGSTRFLARGPNYQLVLGPAEVNFMLRKPVLAPPEGSVRRDESIRVRSASARDVRMVFARANSRATISGSEEMEGKINYLVGNAPDQWRAQISMFAKVKVSALYPGVDLVYYGNQHQLEYDFVVAPGANPRLTDDRPGSAPEGT